MIEFFHQQHDLLTFSVVVGGEVNCALVGVRANVQNKSCLRGRKQQVFNKVKIFNWYSEFVTQNKFNKKSKTDYLSSMNFDQFSKVYKKWSNQQLFDLLQKKHEYQPLAVEAATAELNSRQLSEIEWKELEDEFQLLKSQRPLNLKKQLEHKLAPYKEKILVDFNPHGEPNADRNIRLICYSVSILIVYSFYNQFNWIVFLFKHGNWDSNLVFGLSIFFFVPIGIFYFWQKEKFGWSILGIWCILTILTAVLGYITELRLSDNGLLSRIYHKQGFLGYLITVLVYGGLLVYINSKKITESFNIKIRFQQLVITIGTIMSLTFLLKGYF